MLHSLNFKKIDNLMIFFRKSLEKSQRFQNLQNVFIQKEIQEFNRDLETQGFF